MSERRQITCIGCPIGCPLNLIVEDGKLVEVTGAECKRGDRYAEQESTDPRRMVTTTVACLNGLWNRLPVRTAEAVPKDRMMEVARQLHRLTVPAPVVISQVVLADAAGTGIAVIATRSMPAQQTD